MAVDGENDVVSSKVDFSNNQIKCWKGESKIAGVAAQK